ncbi:MAG TPA: type II secretion system protein GspK [Polyangiaceae bacterium]
MKRARRKKRGVALVLVLGSIAIMTVLLTQFQDEATAELSAALADRDALKAEYLAKSGINLSRLLIAAEPTMRQGLSLLFLGRTPPQIPVWEFSDRILGAFNDKEGTADFAALTSTDVSQGKNLGLEGGRFDVDIVDEDSKINVNMAARGDTFTQNRLATQLLARMAGDQYSPLFERRDRDDNFTDRAGVCGAIIDWADNDENLNACDPYTASPSSQASEDISYQLLKKPYFRKNAPYDSLEELHLVRGVGDDFWATFVDPDPNKPKNRTMTVWGQGAVNVNTASPETLLALVLAGSKTSKLWSDPLAQQNFLFAVRLLRNLTAGIPIFGSGSEFIKAMQGQGMMGTMLKTMGLEPMVFESPAELTKTVTAESKIFSIYADGIVPGYQRKTRVRIHAVLDFRKAPAPGASNVPPSPSGSGSAAAPPPPPPGQFGATPAAGAAAGPDAIQGALSPDPGGTFIYYRME